MRATLAIARKELNVAFTTPVAWAMFGAVVFFTALWFNGLLDLYRLYTTQAVQLQNPELLARLSLTELMGQLLGTVAVFLVIAAPFLSMRLLAEETQRRTLELLLTAPVRPFQIVLGKYLAALVLVGVSVALVAVFPALLSALGRGAGGLEWETVGAGLLGLFLLGAMAMAVGLFFSSLTDSVVVAALVSLVVLLGLWFAPVMAVGKEGLAKDLAAALSAQEHLVAFTRGRLELADVLYYLSFVVLGLFLSERAVEARRWG